MILKTLCNLSLASKQKAFIVINSFIFLIVELDVTLLHFSHLTCIMLDILELAVCIGLIVFLSCQTEERMLHFET